MYTYTIIYHEQPVSQDSNNAAHTLPRRTATTQGLALIVQKHITVAKSLAG